MSEYVADTPLASGIIEDVEAQIRKGDILLPSEHDVFVGDGDYVAIGLEFLNYFIELAGLKKSDCVLDIGCGIGRMAIPLMYYLGPEGRYRGYDVNKKGIDWCKKNLEQNDVRFKFHHIDVFHPIYNPAGQLVATEIRFSLHDNCSDVAIATSLFTHLFMVDAIHYLIELRRLVKPTGRILLTAFLLCDDDEPRLGNSTIISPYSAKGERFLDLANPLAAVFYPIEQFRSFVRDAGLCIDGSVHFGHWRRSGGGAHFQDIVVLRRDPNSAVSLL